MFIIGLTGEPLSGKDAVADYLKTKGFQHFSGGDFIREEMRQKGLPVDRSSIREYIDKERLQKGMQYPADEVAKQVTGDTNVVVSGFRNMPEVEVFQEKFGKDFVLIAVTAPIELRYKRALSRRREGDEISFERFVAEEKAEDQENSGAHEVKKVIQSADHTIDNSGSLEDLHEKVGQLLVKPN